MRRTKIVTVAVASLLSWSQVLADHDQKAEAPQVAGRLQKTKADTHAQRDVLMKRNDGQSIAELERMSHAELDKFGDDVAKKQGR